MAEMKHTPGEGDLRVWWVPQVPMKAFIVPVVSVEEAAKLHDVLADYDLFQYENNVKPDYCNVGGLSVFEDGEWVDWECPETFECDPRKALEARVALARAEGGE